MVFWMLLVLVFYWNMVVVVVWVISMLLCRCFLCLFWVLCFVWDLCFLIFLVLLWFMGCVGCVDFLVYVLVLFCCDWLIKWLLLIDGFLCVLVLWIILLVCYWFFWFLWIVFLNFSFLCGLWSLYLCSG